MELYKLGSLFLDISLALITIGVLTRLVMSMVYLKRNGERTITKEQGKKMAKKSCYSPSQASSLHSHQ